MSSRQIWLLFFSLLFSFPHATAITENQSVLLTKKGTVQVQADADQWIEIVEGQVLVDNTRLRTGDDSSATVQLTTGAILRIGEFSTIDLLPAEAENTTVILSMIEGLFYFFGRDDPESISILTPSSTGAITGTEFLLSVSKAGETTITMLDGTVELSNELGAVHLDSGESATTTKSKKPLKSIVVNAFDGVQWCLYYPGVLSLNELQLTDAERASMAESLDFYKRGDITAAIEAYKPPNFSTSKSVTLYEVNLKMAAGRINEAKNILALQTSESSVARALDYLIAAVNFEQRNTVDEASTASELLALSYYFQSRQDLSAALDAVKNAVELQSGFGYAWARLAELEFSFGHIHSAKAALDTAIRLSPDNPQVKSLSGFIAAANSDLDAARIGFIESIEKDGTFANAWLGSALLYFRDGRQSEGLERLKTATAMEPNRSILRSYLAKGYAEMGNYDQAKHELSLARTLDETDPTPVFYRALVDKSINHFNSAAKGVEQAISLNDNRAVYRSRMLLDQDLAVRNTNLAVIYDKLSMATRAKRMGTRAVADDYNNYAAHLFLANTLSGDLVRSDAVVKNELLLAQMLAPVNAGTLSQYISNQEYSSFFEGKRFGVNYNTLVSELDQAGHIVSIYNIGDSTSFNLDLGTSERAEFQFDRDSDVSLFNLTMKHQISDNRSFYMLAQVNEVDSLNVGLNKILPSIPPFASNNVNRTLNLGYQYNWNPNNNLLFLGTYFSGDIDAGGGTFKLGVLRTPAFVLSGFDEVLLGLSLDVEFYSFDFSHIFTDERKTVVSGVRHSTGKYDATDVLEFIFFDNPATTSKAEETFDTFSAYSYMHYETTDSLTLIAGAAYEYVSYPKNVTRTPVSAGSSSSSQISPKLGFTWDINSSMSMRGIYAQSLGGVALDSSLRLEPAQLAGFTQSFRGLISHEGDIDASEYESWGLGLQYNPGVNTFIDLEWELLEQKSQLQEGILNFSVQPFSILPGLTERLVDYTEKRFSAVLNRLEGDYWSWGLSYNYIDVEFKEKYSDISAFSATEIDAQLQSVTLSVNFNHSSGFYGNSSINYFMPDDSQEFDPLFDDKFTIVNLQFGYRSRGQKWEIGVGVINVGDKDFHVNTFIPFNEVPKKSMTYVLLNVSL